ncbi:hypothetical protein SSS_09603 [Sarcoptes scabiei]|uniref:Fat storage-inducing transmembrane protein 2 n=1 Tax=Sarcoptes scabiei TaxID=52283 RepID=A0A834RHJ2_SARSC|nr:hypothetical protein SSS_09603 [Sarcoptes scabiei]
MSIIGSILTWIQRSTIIYMHHSHIPKRLILYLFSIILFGSIKDYFLDDSQIAHSNHSVIDSVLSYIKSEKKSFLNLYFVKWGWLWTWIALIPFLIFTRIVFVLNQIKKKQQQKNYSTINLSASSQSNATTNLNEIESWYHYRSEIIGPIIRQILTTLVWKFSVQLFFDISVWTGHCQTKNNTLVFLHKTVQECRKEGNTWIYGLDISGHIFLMTFSSLVIIEELRFLLDKFSEFNEFSSKQRLLGVSTANRSHKYQFKLDSFVHWITLILTSIQILVIFIWDYMMIQTNLFYHNLIQKIGAFIWAVFFWFIIYRIPLSYVLPV